MASFAEFIQSLSDPKQKRHFIFSLLALLFWLVAIMTAIFSAQLLLPIKVEVVYGLLGLAAVFSVLSMPKPTAKSSPKTVAKEAVDSLTSVQKEVHNH